MWQNETVTVLINNTDTCRHTVGMTWYNDIFLKNKASLEIQGEEDVQIYNAVCNNESVRRMNLAPYNDMHDRLHQNQPENK